MKIFISWSGDLSKAVALVLRDWLKLVIHGVQPFVSDEDIDKGTRGLAQIASELEAADVGIVCITRDNIERPWVNFEAGAISKKVGDARLIPFLVNLENADIPRYSPLTQFQNTTNSKDEVRRMVHSINRSIEPAIVEEAILDRLFDAFWDELERQLREAIEANEQTLEGSERVIGVGEMVGEILDLVRSQQRDISELRLEMRKNRLADNEPSADLGAQGQLIARGDVQRGPYRGINLPVRAAGRAPMPTEIVSDVRLETEDAKSANAITEDPTSNLEKVTDHHVDDSQ
jgi:hypothetical protein